MATTDTTERTISGCAPPCCTTGSADIYIRDYRKEMPAVMDLYGVWLDWLGGSRLVTARLSFAAKEHKCGVQTPQ